LLANNFFDKHNKPKINPVGWWMSEKYDGIRAVWTGKKLMSRSGKVISAPPSFLALLPPNSSLDGELFTVRGGFNKTSSIISKKIPLEHEWSHVIFHIFDIPHSRDTFENRLLTLQSFDNGSSVRCVDFFKIQSLLHLTSFHDNITSLNGEGVMIRKPLSLYTPSRSNSLLKVKMFKDDDAIIKGYELGVGRLSHSLGSLIVCWKDNPLVVFHVGTGLTDSQRSGNFQSLFPLDSIISVKYFELNSDSLKPRFPVFLHSRFEQPDNLGIN
jgi:DNA ligase-1